MKMKKLLSIVFLFSLIVSFTSVAQNVNAIGIPNGATIKTATNPDVYIVKYKNGKQFKRLVLNPEVFESYGHLRWEDILTVDQSEMDSFVVSDLVRVDGQTDIYQLVPNGDVGTKVLLTSADDHDLDLDLVYIINSVDSGNYVIRNIDTMYPHQPYLILFEDNLNNIYTEAKYFGKSERKPFNNDFGASYSPSCINGTATEDCHSEIMSWVNNRSVEIGKTLNITLDGFDINDDDVFYQISYGNRNDWSYGTMRIIQSWKTNNVFSLPITEQLFNETLSDNLQWDSHFFDSSTRIHYNKNVKLNNTGELVINLCLNDKPQIMEDSFKIDFQGGCILFKYFILKPGYSNLTTSTQAQ